jgi:hypothetical protein
MWKKLEEETRRTEVREKLVQEELEHKPMVDIERRRLRGRRISRFCPTNSTS